MPKFRNLSVAAAFKAAMGEADTGKIRIGATALRIVRSGGNLPPWARRIRGEIALYAALVEIQVVIAPGKALDRFASALKARLDLLEAGRKRMLAVAFEANLVQRFGDL